MKIEIVVPILLLFLWARQVLGDEYPPGFGFGNGNNNNDDAAGYGNENGYDNDDADYGVYIGGYDGSYDGGYGGYEDNDDGYGCGYGDPPVPAGKEDCIEGEMITSVPFMSFGDTTLALGQGFEEAQTCTLVNAFTRGVWFQLAGTGLCYNATSLVGTYQPTIAVYTGEADSCESLMCVIQNDDGRREGGYRGYGNGFGLTSNVLWRTEVGETYYILQGAFCGNAGPYEFSVDVSVKSPCTAVLVRRTRTFYFFI
jgi:hypothetical protein